MSFIGADTDELREAGQKCQEGKETVDQVIAFLRILIAALRAASFFTGGASAAYATYLETVVLPWMQKISMALGLFARVLGANADAQDRVSAGESVDFGALPTYTSMTRGLDSTVTTYDGQIMASGSASGSGSIVPGHTSTGAASGSISSTTSSGGLASVAGVAAGTRTPAPLPSYGTPGTLSGVPGGRVDGSDDVARPPSGAPGDPQTGGGGIGGVNGGIGGAIAGGTGSGTGNSGSTGSSGASNSGNSGSTGLGTGAGIGSEGWKGLEPASGTDPGVTSRAGVGDHFAGAATPGAGTGDGTGSGSGPGSAESRQETSSLASYGAAAGIAGGAAAAGIGGAALAGRGKGNDPEIDRLGTSNGLGSRGADVRALQEKLTAAGYDTRGADGVWGKNTQAAYDAYRQANPLAVTPGSGYSAPSGFDYTQITGVRGNPNVSPEFLRRTEQVAAKVGAKPEHLMAVMSWETGGTFDPGEKAKADGKATGLIQIRDSNTRWLNTTPAQLAAMTPVQQLDYVEKYLSQPHLRGRLGSVEGLYNSIFAGRAAGPDEVLYRRGSQGYELNRALDRVHGNKDGAIQGRETAGVIYKTLRGGR